jgi:hypothetical protein
MEIPFFPARHNYLPPHSSDQIEIANRDDDNTKTVRDDHNQSE